VKRIPAAGYIQLRLATAFKASQVMGLCRINKKIFYEPERKNH
jgi:hypothetical protein